MVAAQCSRDQNSDRRRVFAEPFGRGEASRKAQYSKKRLGPRNVEE